MWLSGILKILGLAAIGGIVLEGLDKFANGLERVFLFPVHLFYRIIDFVLSL